MCERKNLSRAREPTSFKKIAATEKENKEYVAVARHGKKYGYLPQKG